MRQYTPYIFPAIVLIVLAGLLFKWNAGRNSVSLDDLNTEGIQIENLSQEELQKVLNQSGDFSSIQLERPEVVEPDENQEGEEVEQPQELPLSSTALIRYEIEDDKVKFGVIANLPEIEENYQVWLRDSDGETTRQAFELEQGKGGFIGSAALSTQVLPLEILVTRPTSEVTDADILFSGKIPAPEEEN